MKPLVSVLIVFTIIVSYIHAGSADNFIDHHKVVAHKGDGIITLLKRYELFDQRCNIDAFYALNNLKKGDYLYVGKQYTLPIRIYRYNQQSIRSTIGKEDWDVARAIAAYNRLLQDRGLKKVYYMEDKILYVPYHFLDCPAINKGEGHVQSTSKSAVQENTKAAAAEESKKVYLENPLYGKHKRFEKVSDELKGHAYYIISGHGGPDPGAMCDHGQTSLCEDEYAYDVSLRLARNLESHGAKVFMIIQDPNDGLRDDPILMCDKDETAIGGHAIPLKQISRLEQRVTATNKLYKQNKKYYKVNRVIAIHVDSRPKNKRQDVFFYHCPGSKEGKRIADNIHQVFRSKYQKHRANGYYYGTVTDRNLYVLRNTDPPAVYVELANIKNHIDQDRIIIPSNRQYLANWLYEGLIK